MRNSLSRWVTPGVLVRMFADGAMIQVALLAALSLRLLFVLVFVEGETSVGLSQQARSMFGFYLQSTLPLTAICLALFYLHGFYTYGRYYRSRYKALVVCSAVLQGFVLYGFVSYFLTLKVPFPRAAYVLAWALCTGLLLAARVWNLLWQRIASGERPASADVELSQQQPILVIGGAGYIGSSLLPQMLAQGHRVRLLDLLLYGEGPIAEFAQHERLEIVRGDFRHIETVAHAMRGVGAVVHLGAIVGDPACDLDEGLTVEVNLTATRMIAGLAKISGVQRFAFASTCSVYGKCDEMLDERSLARPLTLYGKTKRASEKVVLSMADGTFSPTVLRFATIYGLSGRARFDLVVNLLAAQAKMDGHIQIHGGQQWRPFVHVHDAARAILRVLQMPQEVVGGEIYNVGSNEQNYTIADIGRLVEQQVIGAQLQVSPEKGDARDYRVDFRKIRNQLGFEPKWTLEDGIRQVIEAIANGEVTDYRQPEYSNVEFLRREGSRLARDQWARDLMEELVGE